MSRRRERWAVVGGGMLGLRLAQNLCTADRDVVVYESAESIGGLASAWQVGDVTWDRHYHVTLLSDRRLRDLIGELGLTDEMSWSTTRTGFFDGDRHHSLSSAIDFLKFPLLGPIEKARLASTILYASRLRTPKSLEGRSVEDWLVRWSGRATYQKIWEPLLRCKLGNDFEQVSASFIWATIARLYAARRSGLKQELFGTLQGGYAQLLESYSKLLETDGVTIRCGERVLSIRAGGQPGALELDSSGSGREQFDRVVVTLAPPVAAQLCPQLGVGEVERMSQSPYRGVVCASVLSRRPLRGFYVTNLVDGASPFTGVIEMTALVGSERFGGRHLIYLPRYAPPDDALFAQTDDQLRASWIPALQRIVPELTDADVLEFRVSRARYVFPVPTVDDHVPLPMTSSVPGLHFVNSAHIRNGTLNVNETLTLADDSLPTLLAGSQAAAVRRAA